MAKECRALIKEKGPYVAFVLSEAGEVFGVFTSLGLKSTMKHGQSFADPKAFLFSLTKRSIQNQFRNEKNAVRFEMAYCLAFGYGGDMMIKSKGDQNQESYCTLGNTYKCPDEFKVGEDFQNYLGGLNYFRVIEIEIYSVNTVWQDQIYF